MAKILGGIEYNSFSNKSVSNQSFYRIAVWSFFSMCSPLDSIFDNFAKIFGRIKVDELPDHKSFSQNRMLHCWIKCWVAFAFMHGARPCTNVVSPMTITLSLLPRNRKEFCLNIILRKYCSVHDCPCYLMTQSIRFALNMTNNPMQIGWATMLQKCLLSSISASAYAQIRSFWWFGLRNAWNRNCHIAQIDSR